MRAPAASRRSALLLAAAAAILPACGDSEGGVATLGIPVQVVLSLEGDDQFQSATAGPAGSFYVAGFTSAVAGGPRSVVVVKVLSSGLLDSAFGGGDGVAVLPMETPGNTGEIEIATQSTGKIIVAATVRALGSDDRDLMVARLDDDGSVDTTFGNPATGYARIDLSQDPTLADRDACRALAVNPTNNLIYVHGLMMSDSVEADLDFVVVRLTADGELDTTFGELDGGGPARLGRRFLDLATGQNATARGIRVMADGSVIACGYVDEDGGGGANTPQIVLWKLDASGDPVAAFDGDGVWHENLLALQTEAYGYVVQGTQIVTAGYGRDSGTNNLWVTARFDIDDGDLDTTWGGAPVPGTLIVDPSGAAVDETSNCRDAVSLPGGKILLMGSTGAGGSAVMDAAYAVLGSTGAFDPLYGGAAQVTSLGDDGADQWWAAAHSGNSFLLAGYSGKLAGGNDDAYFMILPVK